MKLIRAGALFGFLVWAAGTAFLVPLGRFVFGPENRLPVALSATLLVVATFAGVFAFARRILARDGAPSFEKAALLGVAACLPGLSLDGALYAFNGGRYPGLDATASGAMSAGLLFAYAAALLATLTAGGPGSASLETL